MEMQKFNAYSKFQELSAALKREFYLLIRDVSEGSSGEIFFLEKKAAALLAN